MGSISPILSRIAMGKRLEGKMKLNKILSSHHLCHMVKRN